MGSYFTWVQKRWLALGVDFLILALSSELIVRRTAHHPPRPARHLHLLVVPSIPTLLTHHVIFNVGGHDFPNMFFFSTVGGHQLPLFVQCWSLRDLSHRSFLSLFVSLFVFIYFSMFQVCSCVSAGHHKGPRGAAAAGAAARHGI